MAKQSRRASRLAAKGRRSAAHQSSIRERRFRRRLALVVLVGLATLLGSGHATRWAALVGSSAVGAFESAPDLASENFVTIVPKSEEELRERWQRLAEQRRQIGEDTRPVVRAKAVVQPLAVGSSAAELSEKPAQPPVSLRAQLAQVAEMGEPLRRAVERLEMAQERADLGSRGRGR